VANAIRFDLIAGVDQWNRGFRDAEHTSSRFGARLRTTIATGAAAAAAGVGALAIGAFKLGESFDSAYDTIRVTTGKTGKSLGGLQKDFKEVVKDVPTDFESAATAVGKLNQRTGQIGKGLQRLAAQELELSRITKTDLGENIAASTRLFRDWSIPTAKQATTLDEMFRAAQATGIGVTDLMTKVVQFGSPLRQLGFSLDQTTALFGEFERAGVVTETVLPGLKLALKSYALAHKDPQKALVETIKRIKESSTTAQANTIAFKTFGARAGPDLAAAIREGHFDLDLLIKTISGGKDTIRTAAADTADFAEKWKLFSNRMKVLAEPAVSALFTAVGNLADKLSKDVAPAIEAFITKHGPQFKEILGGVKRAFDTIYAALADPEKGVVPNLNKLKQSWDDNRQAILDFQNAIPGATALLHVAGTTVHRLIEEVTGAGKIFLSFVALVSRGAQAIRIAFDGIGIGALTLVKHIQTMTIHFLESLQQIAGVVDRLLGTHMARAIGGAVANVKRARQDTVAQIDKLKTDASQRMDALRHNLSKPIKVTAALSLSFSPSFTQKDWVQVRLAAGRMASGGLLRGPGGPRGDRIPIMASDREFMQPADAVAHYGVPFMEAIRKRQLPRFASGGPIGQIGMEARAINKVEAWGTGQRMDRGLNKIMSMFSSAGGGNLGQWIAAALAITNTAATWGAAIRRRVMFESGGNPNAINLTDSNFLAGHPSQGLMQTIPSTFFGYHQAGTSFSITDPVANIAAAINYIKSRYGTIFAIDPPVRGYDRGGMLPPGLSMAYNGTGRPEPVGAAGGNTYNIAIHPAPGMSERRVGQMVVEALDARDRRAAKGRRA
jgi:phage-related minor tail protein